MAAAVVCVRVVSREAQDKITLRAILQETRMAVPLSRRKRNRHPDPSRLKKSKKTVLRSNGAFWGFNCLRPRGPAQERTKSNCASPGGCKP